MTDYADLWKGTLGQWMPLADLWRRITSQFGMPPEAAIRILRIPLETGQVRAVVPGWRNPVESERHAEMQDWVVPGYSPSDDPVLSGDTSWHMAIEPGSRLKGDPQVSPEGWKHIDLNTGTLNGFEVLVSGQDVEHALRAADPATPPHPATAAGGTRDPRPDAREWMARWLAEEARRSGKVPKWAEAVRECKASGYTELAARDAYDHRPEELRKRGRGKPRMI